MTDPREKVRDETGSTTPLIIGFTVVLLVMVAVVVDASAAYLHRSGLNSIADGAALAGTEAVDEDLTYRQGLGHDPVLTRPLAAAAVEDYLREVQAHARFPGLRVIGIEVTRHHVTVRVEAPLRLPLQVPGTERTAHIGSTGASELTVGR
jgi:hypothetical protein